MFCTIFAKDFSGFSSPWIATFYVYSCLLKYFVCLWVGVCVYVTSFYGKVLRWGGCLEENGLLLLHGEGEKLESFD